MDGIYAPASLWLLLPETVLAAAACALLPLGQARREVVRRAVPACMLAAIIAALLLVLVQRNAAGAAPAAGGGMVFDWLANFVRISALIVGVALTLVLWSQPDQAERGEFFSMALLSLTGLMLVGSAADLVVLFLALELVSIPTYILVTLSRARGGALEAGTKYFYLGAMSAAVMAYGFSFLYGASGTTALYGPHGIVPAVADALATGAAAGPRYAVTALGLALSIGGLLFKIAAVPLHFYIADVYQGAASSVAGLLGFVPKLAGITAILKVLSLAAWQTTEPGLYVMLWVTALLSMTVGNVLALRQTNVKRMLAYSGIAHSGYMLVALLAGPNAGPDPLHFGGMLSDGAAAVLFYSVIYGIANLGAFALLALLRVNGQACETVRDLAGLLARSPGPALLMALAMFTLMGLPPTAGFWGKLTLFGSTLTLSQASGVAPVYQTWTVALVVLAVLNSALAAAYYLRVVAAVLLHENDEPAQPAPREALHTGAVLCGMLLLIFTFYPNFLLQPSRAATDNLRRLLVRPLIETDITGAPAEALPAETPGAQRAAPVPVGVPRIPTGAVNEPAGGPYRGGVGIRSTGTK
jgi:NADH-quinone oxidoreductase subunit N